MRAVARWIVVAAAVPLTRPSRSVTGPFGLEYNPLTDRWSEGGVDINYMMVATKG